MSVEVVSVIFTILVGVLSGIAWLIRLYSKDQEKIEKLKAQHTNSALNRLNEEIKDFKLSVTSIQATIKDLAASLSQNRSDIAVLKERLDETKRLLERYEKTQSDTVRNMIKSELTNLTQKIMLIKTKRTP